MKPERKLNQKQIALLLLAYRFRCLSTDTVARNQSISQYAAYSALKILHSRDFLGRSHDRSYRLANKAARYWLTPKAIAQITTHQDSIDKRTLSARRHEARRSAEFMDLQLELFRLYLELKAQLPPTTSLLVATDLAQRDDVLRPLPGLYIRGSGAELDFFIELTDNQHLFLVKKRIRKYIDHCDSGDWEEVRYPTVLLIRDNPYDRRRLRQYIENRMDDAYLDDEDIMIKAVSKQTCQRLLRESYTNHPSRRKSSAV